jgi:hypothetical protein
MNKIIVLFSLLFASMIGCTSYSIKYPQELETKKISSTLFVKTAEMDINDSELGLFFKGTFREKTKGKIITAAKEADFTQILINELKKIDVSTQNKVQIVINDNLVKKEIPQTPQTDQEKAVNPYIKNIKPLEISPAVKTPYILVVDVCSFIYNAEYKNYKVYASISLYDSETGKIVYLDFIDYAESNNPFTSVGGKYIDNKEEAVAQFTKVAEVIAKLVNRNLN